jgi:hypothetical protein
VCGLTSTLTQALTRGLGSEQLVPIDHEVVAEHRHFTTLH